MRLERILDGVEKLGLIVILVATVVAAGQEVWTMVQELEVRLADLLLMFIYLEVIAMIGVYFEAHELPVRFPLYIAMIALARHIILASKGMSAWDMVGLACAILVLALAILLLRWRAPDAGGGP
jgi:protein PsiE